MNQDLAAGPSGFENFNHPMGLGFEGTLGDMRFVGWVGIAYGVLTCLSLAGAIVGVPLVIVAHRFLEGVNRFDLYRRTADENELRLGFHEMGRSFRLLKILILIQIVMAVAGFVFMVFLGGLGLMSGMMQS